MKIANGNDGYPWVVDSQGLMYSFNGVGWNKEQYNSSGTVVYANDIGISGTTIYTLDSYGTPSLLDYNAKERILMTTATQTSTFESATNGTIGT